MQMQNFEKHVWAEIDLDALRANFRTVKQRAGSLPLCAVVKADSYGHGAVQCARVFAQEGASWLAVSCLAEARPRQWRHQNRCAEQSRYDPCRYPQPDAL